MCGDYAGVWLQPDPVKPLLGFGRKSPSANGARLPVDFANTGRKFNERDGLNQQGSSIQPTDSASCVVLR
jgi:hypothetical protein